MNLEKQELHCHNCNKYVQFDLDLSIDGNYTLNCPNCKHPHYRVVENGKITDIRWDSANRQFVTTSGVPTSQPGIWVTVSTSTYTTTSTWDTYSSVSTSASSSSSTSTGGNWTWYTYDAWTSGGWS